METDLVEVYTQTFEAEGKFHRDAVELAETLLSKSKTILKERGWENFPPNLGDLMLSHENENSDIRARLEWVRSQGATDDDIRQWNNLHPLERIMVEQADDFARTRMYVSLRKSGVAAEDAAKRVFKFHAKFDGDPIGPEDDRPLPMELKLRILAFTERCYAEPVAFRTAAEESSSFNAIVRRAIRMRQL